MPGAIDFSLDEILEMGQRIEKNGAAFYRRAAELHPEGRALLLDLAAQEDVHHAVFEGMRLELTAREKGAPAHDPEGQAPAFLKTLVDHYRFVINQDPAAMLSGEKKLADILDMAAGLEKDSIVFYTTMKDLVPRGAGRDKVDGIIKEELKHLAWIEGELGKIRAA
ncbi:MAG: ferritin family protein [Kiritimatiellae bacterium]|nr:ferritin family protein [Kiritimatiellia bacterium]